MPRTQQPVLAVPPRPRRRLSIRQFLRIAPKNSLATCDEELFDRLIVRRDFLGFSLVVVSDPAAIRHILVDNCDNYRESHVKQTLLRPGLGEGLLTAEGEVWRRHRRRIAPLLSTQATAVAAAMMPEFAEQLASELLGLPRDQPIDIGGAIAPTMRRLLSAILFGPDADEAAVFGSFKMYPAVPRASDFFPWLRRLVGTEQRRRPHESTFDTIMFRMIAERRGQSPTGRQDLLGLLTEGAPEAGEPLGDLELRDEMATLIYGGLNTSLRAIVFVWYLLAMHPWAEAKLHAELDQVLDGRSPDAKVDLPRLVFTRKLIEETMRLYPPIPIISRTAIKADVVCGQKIPKGAYVVIAPWIVHRHRKLWNDPETFDPERFAPENAAARPRHAYIPFSAGPRTCAASALARVEMTLVVATLAQRCRFRLAPGQSIVPSGAATLHVEGGIKMFVEPRQTAPAE
jgi:cytochrome P450